MGPSSSWWGQPIALVLASVGIYGAVSRGVAQRTNEIGIRMALGAAGSPVLEMVIRQGITLGTIGLALGFLLALPLTRVLSSVLFELSPTDPLTFIVIGVIFLAVALVASFLPARRATRIDPTEALRYE